MANVHRGWVRGVQNRALGCGNPNNAKRARVVGHVGAHDAPDPERGIGVGVCHRHIDADARLRRGPREVDVDARRVDRHGGHEIDRLVDPVESHRVVPGAMGKVADEIAALRRVICR